MKTKFNNRKNVTKKTQGEHKKYALQAEPPRFYSKPSKSDEWKWSTDKNAFIIK